MLSPQAIEKIKNLADEVSRREGCLLYDMEFSGSTKHRVLRIFIEAETGSVSIEQCSNVSKGLSLLLDVEDIVAGGEYELEISSPGIERPLRLPWHFKKAVGEDIKLITVEPIAGLKGDMKSLTGKIISADDGGATVRANENEVYVPMQNIKRAQVVFHYKKNDKKR
ncbi:MAG: hypothetical protein A2Z20_05115 [Bdellovibrionales bacterium RBG_16_40_8]|nr:MAG: hypothetical protein A2Z20_05115 [Bdellovibrionales bacterium RBG_16_40_8]